MGHLLKRNPNFYSPFGEGFVQPKFSAVQGAYNTEKLTMTTTQNVTELQPRMTREQLIDAARKAAPLLPPASQWLMNELANRYDVQGVALCESMEQRKSLAIENTVLRDDVICWCQQRVKSDPLTATTNGLILIHLVYSGLASAITPAFRFCFSR
ncbi:hypothetical protein BED43_24845 [Citrobacter freundii]|nr:hypothetical protein BED43_24845 [Citrobacter freundii]OIZ49075.1 hypothetical protein BEH74_24810 [Citrobacter freundii]